MSSKVMNMVAQKVLKDAAVANVNAKVGLPAGLCYPHTPSWSYTL